MSNPGIHDQLPDDLFRHRIAAALRQLDLPESDADITGALDAIECEPINTSAAQRILEQVRHSIARTSQGEVAPMNLNRVPRQPGAIRPAEPLARTTTASAQVFLIVACVSLLLIVGVILSQFGASRRELAEKKRESLSKQLIAVTEPPVAQGATIRKAQPGETLSTGPREKRRVTLSDGSVLSMNEKTTVTIVGPRRIKLLTGEVFVEVVPAGLAGPVEKPDVNVRFVVETARRQVTALGTKFVVKSEGQSTNVIVTQGKVQVSGVAEVIASGQELIADLTESSSVELRPARRSAYVVEWVKDLMAAANSVIVPTSAHSGGTITVIDPQGQEMKLSLRKFHVDVHIEDGFARTTIDQTYFNHTWQQLEGTFRFPLPADASLSRLAMYVNGTLMEGGMVERDYGRNVFEQIRHTRRDPALLEWVDGSTFQMRVFPLEARQEKRILLSYTQRLSNDYGKSLYRFPAGHNLDGVREWSTQVRVKDGAGTKWYSPSHLLDGNSDGSDLKIVGREQYAAMDRDLVLELGDDSPFVSPKSDPVWSRFEQDGFRYVMVRLRPELNRKITRTQHHWIFLIENSADRDTVLAETQRQIVKVLLENSEHSDTFSIIRAGTQPDLFRDKAVECSLENVAAGLDFLKEVAPIGALDLSQALQSVHQQANATPEAWIVHLGTGIPVLGERDPTTLIRQLPPKARYFGVAVGKRWSKSFMETAAKQTGGHVVQINPDEAVAWRAFELLSTLNAPRLTEISIAASAIPDGKSGAETAQFEFLRLTNSVSHGQELAAVARLPIGQSLPQSIIIAGKLNDETYSETVSIPTFGSDPSVERQTGSAGQSRVVLKSGHLPRTWARLEIDRLVALGSAENKGPIIELSKSMYVMSPFTSLLVLETEAMYEQFKVDRGRKDHWAMYGAPAQIPVVAEPAPAQLTLLDAAKERLKQSTVRVQTAEKNYERSLAEKRPTSDLNRLQRVKHAELAEVKLLEREIQRIEQANAAAADPVRKAWESVILRRIGWQQGYRPLYSNFNGRLYYRNQWGEADWSFRGSNRFGVGIDGFKLNQTDGLLTDGLLTDGLLTDVTRPENEFATKFYGRGDVLDGRVPMGLSTFVSFGDGRQQRTKRRDELIDLMPNETGQQLDSGLGRQSAWIEMPGDQIGSGRLLTGLIDRFSARSDGFRPQMSVSPYYRELIEDAYFTNGRDIGGKYGGGGGDLPGRQFGWETPMLMVTPRIIIQEEESTLLPSLLNTSSQYWDRPRLASTGVLADDRWGTFGSIAVDFESVARHPLAGLLQDLPSYAPGLQTWTADRLEVAEKASTKKPTRGIVDPEARRLIEKARSLDWESIRLVDINQKPVRHSGLVIADGAGRFKFDREVSERLQETVINDGTTLWHLYPEIGLGAKRIVSRFHDSAIQSLIPWYVPSVDNLSLNADLKVAGERTVRITTAKQETLVPAEGTKPHEVAEKSNSKPEAVSQLAVELVFADSSSPHHVSSFKFVSQLAVELVFADEGRLIELRLIDTVKDSLLTKQMFAADGTIRLLNADGKLLSEARYERSVVHAPNLAPATGDLVVLPLPYRSSDSVGVTVPVNLQNNAPDYAKLSDDDALKLLATYFAEVRWPELETFIAQRFAARNDRRIGFAVLVASVFPQNPIVANATSQHPELPLARFLEQFAARVTTGTLDGNMEVGTNAAPFLNRLCGAYNVLCRWSTERAATRDRSAAEIEQELEQTLKYVVECRSLDLALKLLATIQDGLKRVDRLNPMFARQLNTAAAAIAADRESSAFARQARIEWLLLAGDVESEKIAQTLFRDHLFDAIQDSHAPDLRNEVRTAFAKHFNTPNGQSCQPWADLVREAAKTLSTMDRPTSMVTFARRCVVPVLGEPALAAEIMQMAIRDQDLKANQILNRAALEYAKEASDWNLAEACVARALDDTVLQKQSSLWRDAARIAHQQQKFSEWIENLEKAYEIEFAALPKTVNLQTFRQDYESLFGQLEQRTEQLVDANRVDRESFAKIVQRAATRWREIDTDDTNACHRAARMLTKLGQATAAWNYWTTPLAGSPDLSTAWTSFANAMQTEQRFVIADKAWTTAYTCEPTNPEILLNHARFLQSTKQSVRAHTILTSIVTGSWQPRFEGIRTQAQSMLSGQVVPQ